MGSLLDFAIGDDDVFVGGCGGFIPTSEKMMVTRKIQLLCGWI